MKTDVIVLLVIVALGACRPATVEDEDFEPTDAQMMRAESAANALVEELGGHLVAELERSGPLGAIDVCSQDAQRIAERHNSEDLRIRRVSLKVRNQADVPDAWEAEKLAELEALAADGDLPSRIVSVEKTGGGHELRYLKPLSIAPPCLHCHGEELAMDVAVRARLAELYPEDRAVGYALGDLRGAVSVKLALQ